MFYVVMYPFTIISLSIYIIVHAVKEEPDQVDKKQKRQRLQNSRN